MAALVTSNVDHAPLANGKWLVYGQVAAVTADADDWIAAADIDALKVHQCWGNVLGATALAVNLERNARGTGVAEETNPGDIGIEASAAGPSVVSFGAIIDRTLKDV